MAVDSAMAFLSLMSIFFSRLWNGDCAVLSYICNGMVYSFGILYIELAKSFNTTSSAAAWVLSAQRGITSLVGKTYYHFHVMLEIVLTRRKIYAVVLLMIFAGPIVSALLVTYGAPMVVIIKALLITIGTLLSAYAPNISYIYLTYSVIIGMYMNAHIQKTVKGKLEILIH